ncbi:hypothetical protein [Dictyobacter kobayashii]|uniref:Uncharacterized protein n=1 Tax=Dictyobacter kobayashii TaxID=2014872 RepID=A0A402AEP0_9CHLR|nr:hypothetical protein [Dictyobacter kobayashii]GCE17561.1 hypothetical protein KDK_13610 [Dictyobacter kobayashii]
MDHSPPKQLTDIASWITRLERQATELLSSANLDDLNSKECINLSLKMLGHIQRLLVLNQQLTTTTTTDNGTNLLIATLTRQMRGEPDPSDPTPNLP